MLGLKGLFIYAKYNTLKGLQLKGEDKMKVLNPEHIRKLMIFSNSSPYAALLGMKVVEVDLG